MVLESLIGPQDAEEHPWKIVLLGIAFATLAVWLAGAAGLGSAGIIIVGLSSIAAIPFLLRLFDYDASGGDGGTFLGSTTLARHFPVLLVMASLFFGLLAGFVFWQLYLPQKEVGSLFDAQIRELNAINPSTGRATNPAFGSPIAAFQMIFFHNLQVLGIIVVLSVLYGAGAVAVLSWNASVIATFLSALAQKFAGVGGGSGSLLNGLGTGFFGILPHGTFELLAYLTATLAGGIISASILRNQTQQEDFTVVLWDSGRMVVLSVVFLAVGAVLESSLLG